MITDFQKEKKLDIIIHAELLLWYFYIIFAFSFLILIKISSFNIEVKWVLLKTAEARITVYLFWV